MGRAGGTGGGVTERAGPFLARLRLAVAVQVGQRWLLLLVADLLLLVQGLFAALIGGGDPDDFYRLTALLPLLLLTPLALADLVALEKRSGTLDLSLSLGSRETLFLMRTGAVAALAWLQGSAVMVVVWESQREAVPLLGALLQLAAVCAVAAAASLFWSVYLSGAGATWVATVASLAVLGRWTFFNPVPSRWSSVDRDGSMLIAPGGPEAVAVLAGASLLLVAYALRRLRRPETLLR